MSSLNSSVTRMSRAIASRSASGSSSVPDGRVLEVVSLDDVEDVAEVGGAAVVVVLVVVLEPGVQAATTSATTKAKEYREITQEIYRHAEENLRLSIASTAEDTIENPDRVLLPASPISPNARDVPTD